MEYTVKKQEQQVQQVQIAGQVLYLELSASLRQKHRMKRLIATILLFISFLVCGQEPLTAQINEYDLTLRQLTVAEKSVGTLIIVEATLTNNTADTLFYFSMSCSWQQFYHTDNKNITVHIDKCDKNFQTVVVVPPKGQKTVMLNIPTKIVLATNPIALRIGLDLYKAKNLADHCDFDKLNRKATIIWSDKLVIK